MSFCKKTLLSIASFAVISAANASPLKIGSIGFSGISPLAVELPVKGEFSNDFAFSLQEGNGLQIGLTSFFWGDAPSDAPEIRFILSGGPGAGMYLPFVSVSTDDVSFAAGMTLGGLDSSGTYFLRIEGTNAINLGETYSLQLAATTISEPESRALMLAALGLVGLFTRRRNNIAKETV